MRDEEVREVVEIGEDKKRRWSSGDRKGRDKKLFRGNP